ncbi:MAG: pyruvate, water dikinase [Candidatus Cloacimonetes bacterium]|nr:pyruvate, water dikinase [Candidatus Cloacimonadota bacterium]
MRYIRFFHEISNQDVPLVGGKNASIGEMFQKLVPKGVKVPNGFAITSEAYWDLLDSCGIREEIQKLLHDVDVTDLDVLQVRARKIRELIFETPIPKDMRDEILEAYKKLSEEYGMEEADVAVRSSATAEDLPDASFAGQQDTYLSIQGAPKLIHHIKRCFASLFTDRAVSYRQSRGFDHFKVALSVGVQKMVRSDKACSGVMFSIDTETGFDKVILITSSWGLGENVVGGNVIPDEFYVFKPTLKTGSFPILKRQLGHKHIKMVYAPPGAEEATRNIPCNQQEMETFSLDDPEVLELARYAAIIEEHYSLEAGTYRPMDMEWAQDGVSGDIFIVQARPETVVSQELKGGKKTRIETYRLKVAPENRKILLKGKAVGGKIGSGKVHIIEDIMHMNQFQEGEILVTDNTDPDWEPAMKKASAIVTNRGGRTCHAAIVAREIGVPAIVGSINATTTLAHSHEVTVSCAEGEDGFVYDEELPFEIETVDLSNLETPKTKLMLNVGDPEKAFGFAQLPNMGVGLARMEFIINNHIKAHPLALMDMYNGKTDVQDLDKIRPLIAGYSSPRDFFIKKLAEGVGTIVAAFHPNPVIVRTSDFKSNEYKRMVGGAAYEPDEENPMIGYRGASRYYSTQYRPAFEWECQALRMVHDEMGLTNMKIMIPFLRTPEEGKKVLEIMRHNGLIQGKNGLEIYIMCELPSNVLLADEFLRLFDGFSIGSNDLTQLTLGVDRDGQLVTHIFDERNPAVKKMLKMAIEACHKHKKYVGICGQAPSDYPEMAEYLVKLGITSISLNPDSILSTWQHVLKVESRAT